MTLRPSRRAAATGLLSAGLLAVSMVAGVGAQTPATAPATSPATPSSSLDGTWTLDRSIGTYDYTAGTGSWAGYRVQEELAGIGGTTAVGRTPDITGSISLAGTQLMGADLGVDLTTLASDESMRDGQLGRQGIETDRFPTATFVLTEPIELGAIPAEGTAVNVTAVGDLTLHGVTKNVSIPLVAVQQGDIIGVKGSVTFTWGDFGMTQPSSMRVVSLANDVTMEFQAYFRHDAAAPVTSPAASPVTSPAG